VLAGGRRGISRVAKDQPGGFGAAAKDTPRPNRAICRVMSAQTTAETPMTADDVLRLVEEREVRFVRLWFTDVLGRLKSFSIGASELAAAFAEGMGFDGSSVTGFNAIEESDMVAVADPSTFAVLPWRPEAQGVGRVFCDILTPERVPYEGDPRQILRRALARAEGLGFDTFNVGPELEYFLFKDARGTEVLDEGGYFDLTTLDAGSDVRRETVLALEQLGIHVEYSHHEVGPSQHEVDMRYAPALKMADDCMTYRITVKEYALKYGWHATFMPKPLFGENGSGMHTHMSLFRNGQNTFFDADDPYYLSDVGKAFIAGQLRHARELCSIYAQWVNSYKRLIPGYEAPVYLAWSRRNRSALVRVPLYHPGKERSTRMELRCPDPACNPYLTFAALLQAGLEGIEKGYELPEPMEQNLYHLSPQERVRLGIEQLPETLGEAIELTAQSELALRTLGEHTFNRYIEIKREEWNDYRAQVTQWELDRYLPVL
jgi:glutamine synthetase